MPYECINTDEQDDIIVGFLRSQEKDEYCHSTNLARFNDMLVGLPAGRFKDRITQLRDDTQERLNEVQAIIASTMSQLPDQTRIDASLGRIRAREGQTSTGQGGGN